MLTLYNVKCCGLKNPLGLDNGGIDFSWKLKSDRKNVVQKTYRICVFENGKTVWDSGVNHSETQSAIRYDGKPLVSGTEYSYSICVSDNHGENAVSEGNIFSMALQISEWKACWIGCQKEDLAEDVKIPSKEIIVEAFKKMASGEDSDFKPDRQLDPCRIFWRKFTVKEKPVKSYLSLTAHGIYEARINGKRVSESWFEPGFTVYDSYLETQTYDVTALLNTGENVLTVEVADGWYKGKYGILAFGNNYGTQTAVLAQLAISFGDGQTEYVRSDSQWQYGNSNCLYSDFLIGEKQDGRIDLNRYYRADTDTSDLKYAAVLEYGYDNLRGISCEPVTCTCELEPKEIFVSPKGELIVDFGQNTVGVVRLTVQGEAGTEVKLEHTEVLDTDGSYMNNISGYNRDQTDYYILRGGEAEVFQPKFTFHGFRYVRITGYPGTLRKENIRCLVLGTNLADTGSFSCSNKDINQLQSNIQWSQRGNMLSIPTDCPQRERAGWTGDIQVYCDTAVFNQNVYRFLKKWLRNMEAEQYENGLVPIVIPWPTAYNAINMDVFGSDTSAGWGDAAITLPYVLYRAYGDANILKENFSMMKKWMDYVEWDAASHMPALPEDASPERIERQKYLWNTGFHYGDWLYPSCKTPTGEADMFRSAYSTKEYVATALFAQSCNMMSQVCAILGKNDLAQHYKELKGKIAEAFEAEYVKEDGSIDHAVQGIYVLAIATDLVKGEKMQRMTDRLAEMIHQNNDCLDTGFLSIKYLLDVLADHGYKDMAKTLLYRDVCPSWLYEVKKGATTIWETWNTILEDDTRTTYSHNHYAFGCVGDWMYRNLAGLQVVEPGYKKFRIEPDFSYGLSSATLVYDSTYGVIGINWTIEEADGKLCVDVLVGTQAQICLPGISETVGSGKYEFSFEIK